jgi:hypothetical protein
VWGTSYEELHASFCLYSVCENSTPNTPRYRPTEGKEKNTVNNLLNTCNADFKALSASFPVPNLVHTYCFVSLNYMLKERRRQLPSFFCCSLLRILYFSSCGWSCCCEVLLHNLEHDHELIKAGSVMETSALHKYH